MRSESEIQAEILEWLRRRPDILVVRIPLGAVIGRNASGGRQRRTNPLKGFPDILGIRPGRAGRMFTIECKREGGGKLSADQIEWRDDLVASGVLYICARSLGEVLEALCTGENRLE